MSSRPEALKELQLQAGEAARVLKLVANKQRLLVLCHLIMSGEMQVNALVEAVGLSQSALSQHLARLRKDKIVDFRREATTLYYRVSDPRVAALMTEMKKIFCP